MAYTVYREHNCWSRHRTWRKTAECIWPRAVWVTGEGRFALLARCHVLTVTLWETPEEAEERKRFIDRTACGGRCHRDHKIIELAASIRA